jgi:hypothetical protein
MGIDVEHRNIGINLKIGLDRAYAYGMLAPQHAHHSTGAGVTGDGRSHPLNHVGRPSHMRLKGLSRVNPDKRNIQIKLVIVIF